MRAALMNDELTQDKQRQLEEAAFFDRRADQAAANLAPLDSETVRRYQECRRRRFSKEFRLAAVGSLIGKRLLDVGCGDGGNAILLAKLGAEVVGVDISPKAIALAKKRSTINGVDENVSFLCVPLESVDLPSNHFDVVWVDNLLHHVIPILHSVMAQLADATRDDGILVFAEPVNFSKTLRRIRHSLPVHTEATPGERPLRPKEIDVIEQHLNDFRLRPYSLVGRLSRFILTDGNYEGSGFLRRGLCNVVMALDYAVLALPVFRKMAAECVITGRPRK